MAHGSVALAVPRKMTMAGGFEISLEGLPAKPSGRTGAGGDLLKPEMADANFEAHRLLFELQHTLATIGEELHGERHVLAGELLKGMLMRVDDMRKYVQTLADQNLIPRACPRCRTEPTDDPSGATMCPLCVEMAFRQVRRP